MTTDYHLESLSDDDVIESEASYEDIRAAVEEAEAEAAEQRAAEWAAFEQDMHDAYPWPDVQEIDEFEPRKAA